MNDHKLFFQLNFSQLTNYPYPQQLTNPIRSDAKPNLCFSQVQ